MIVVITYILSEDLSAFGLRLLSPAGLEIAQSLEAFH